MTKSLSLVGAKECIGTSKREGLGELLRKLLCPRGESRRREAQLEMVGSRTETISKPGAYDDVAILRFLGRNETAAPRGPRPNRETMKITARVPGRPQS
jgi:hypothetical protein